MRNDQEKTLGLQTPATTLQAGNGRIGIKSTTDTFRTLQANHSKSGRTARLVGRRFLRGGALHVERHPRNEDFRRAMRDALTVLGTATISVSGDGTSLTTSKGHSDGKQFNDIAVYDIQALPSNCLTVAITCSGSKPNFLCSSFKGAEAPNVLMPMTRPAVPT